MTLKEEITRAAAKVGTPEFQSVTCKRADGSRYNLFTKYEDGKVSADVVDVAKEFAVSLVATQHVAPYTAIFMLIPPPVFLHFVTSLFVSAFEAGRAFEQNRQDVAIAELLERENRE